MSKIRDQAYQQGYWEGFSLGQYEVQRTLAENLLELHSDDQNPTCEDKLLQISELTTLSIPRIRLIAKQMGLRCHEVVL